MNRILAIALALVLGSLGVRWLYHAMVSDETRIRWTIERMADGFNEAKAGRAVSGLARDWTHEGRPVDRETIRGYVFQESFQERDPETKQFLWKVELPPDTLSITVQGDTAKLTTEVLFSHLDRDAAGTREWKVRWHLRLEADLRKGDDGWKIFHSRHEDIQGVMLGR